MRVTEIKQSIHSKSKSDIYSYGEFLFSLYNTDIRKLSIEVGGDIENPAEIEKLLKKNALSDALKLLMRADYPTKVITEKLNLRKYPDEIISEVINELNEKGYTDDNSYAEKFVKNAFLSGKKGKAYVEAELARRGIEKDIYKELISEYYDSEALFPLAEKKLKSISKGDTPTINELMKLKNYLLRQGFSYEEISSVIERLKL